MSGNSPAYRGTQILILGLSHLACTWKGAQKGTVCGCILLAQELLEKPAFDICVNYFFSCLLFFFFFWLSCSSLLIYCICSRGLGKGGSQTVSLPKGKEAGRHSYFSPQVMYVKVSQWENGRYKRAESWWRYLLSENRRKKHLTLELHPDKLEVSEVCFLSVVRTFPLILYILW